MKADTTEQLFFLQAIITSKEDSVHFQISSFVNSTYPSSIFYLRVVKTVQFICFLRPCIRNMVTVTDCRRLEPSFKPSIRQNSMEPDEGSATSTKPTNELLKPARDPARSGIQSYTGYILAGAWDGPQLLNRKRKEGATLDSQPSGRTSNGQHCCTADYRSNSNNQFDDIPTGC